MAFFAEFWGNVMREHIEEPSKRKEDFDERLNAYEHIRQTQRTFNRFEEIRSPFGNAKVNPIYLNQASKGRHVPRRRRDEDQA